MKKKFLQSEFITILSENHEGDTYLLTVKLAYHEIVFMTRLFFIPFQSEALSNEVHSIYAASTCTTEQREQSFHDIRDYSLLRDCHIVRTMLANIIASVPKALVSYLSKYDIALIMNKTCPVNFCVLKMNNSGHSPAIFADKLTVSNKSTF